MEKNMDAINKMCCIYVFRAFKQRIVTFFQNVHYNQTNLGHSTWTATNHYDLISWIKIWTL